MSEKTIGQLILANNKWKNIEYDLNNGHSNNCTLNISIGYAVNFTIIYFHLIIIKFQIKLVKLTGSLFEIESDHLYNVLIPLFSQATKCKILISHNSKYGDPQHGIPILQKVLDKNVVNFTLTTND